MSLLTRIFTSNDHDREAEKERQLIRREAKIGGQLFGKIPAGHRREFFCLDEHTWVWHEEWVENGQRKIVTTHYHVRPSGVVKTQDGKTYHELSLSEARNLYRATELYCQRVDAMYESILQAA